MASKRYYRVKDPDCIRYSADGEAERGLIIAEGIATVQRANHIGVAYMRDTGHRAVLERMTTLESVLHRCVIPRAG